MGAVPTATTKVIYIVGQHRGRSGGGARRRKRRRRGGRRGGGKGGGGGGGGGWNLGDLVERGLVPEERVYDVSEELRKILRMDE